MYDLHPGAEYRRRDIHAKFGGQQQGGISTPANSPVVLLFTGSTGTQYGYSDEWTPEGLMLYFGEGVSGDMQFIRGNAAVRDHVKNGRDLLLFESTRKAHVRYLGEMTCVGFRWAEAPDMDGQLRQAIVFELVPTEQLRDVPFTESPGMTLDELKNLALDDSVEQSTPIQRLANIRRRSAAIKRYARVRAGGMCEGCGVQAPFSDSNGMPYLEVHHVKRLADGGPDHPDSVVAICPNCHRRAHYSQDSVGYNQTLTEKASVLASTV